MKKSEIVPGLEVYVSNTPYGAVGNYGITLGPAGHRVSLHRVEGSEKQEIEVDDDGTILTYYSKPLDWWDPHTYSGVAMRTDDGSWGVFNIMLAKIIGNYAEYEASMAQAADRREKARTANHYSKIQVAEAGKAAAHTLGLRLPHAIHAFRWASPEADGTYKPRGAYILLNVESVIALAERLTSDE